MSDALQALSNAAVINALISPIKDLMKDFREIASGYELPEHSIHAFFLTAAFVVGSALPFVDATYGNWLGGIMEAFGLAGGAKSFASWVASTWVISSTTSAVATWGNKLSRRYISGDWDYRLTSAQCLEIEAELAAIAAEEELPDLARNSTEIRAIFNECVRYKNKNPDGKGDGFRQVLECLLRGDYENAIADYADRKEELNLAAAKVRERLSRFRRRKSANNTLEPAEERKTAEPEVNAWQSAAPTANAAGPVSATPAVAITIVDNAITELTRIPPAEQAAPSVRTIRRDAATSPNARSPRARAAAARKGSNKGSLTKAEAALAARLTRLDAALGGSVHKYSVAHPEEAVDHAKRALLIQAALEVRLHLLQLKQQRGELATTVEEAYQRHSEFLNEHSDSDIERLLTQDEQKISTAVAAAAQAMPNFPQLVAYRAKKVALAAAGPANISSTHGRPATAGPVNVGTPRRVVKR